MNLRAARRSREKLLSAIAAHAHDRAGIGATLVPRLRDRFIRSAYVKASALHRLRPMPGNSVQELIDLADAMDLLAPCAEAIPWRRKAKSSGGYRAVVDLPLRLRIAHELAMELIIAQVEPGPHIFNWRGRGSARCAAAVERDLVEAGPFVVIGDVRRCFASVNPDAILSLDLLPPEFVRCMLDHRQLRFVCRGDIPLGDDYRRPSVERTEQPVPQGLLEGSPASDPLMAAMFNDLPDHLEAGVMPRLFSDNIVVACPSEEASCRVEESLVRYFTDHPAGPFSLRRRRAHVADRFEFIGYQFALGEEGRIAIEPSQSNYVKAIRRLMSASPDFTTEDVLSRMLAGLPAVSASYLAFLIDLIEEERWSQRPPAQWS